MEQGNDIRTVQKLMGHSDLNITMVYAHLLMRGLDVTDEPTSCSYCDKGLPGPITSAHYEQSCLKAAVAGRV